jgi:hypothetical protein
LVGDVGDGELLLVDDLRQVGRRERLADPPQRFDDRDLQRVDDAGDERLPVE